MPSIFLSYSTKDSPFVSRLAEDLRNDGITVWLDAWEITAGDSLVQKISHGLDNMELVVVILSENSISSGWVEKEWQSKIGDEAQEKRVLILPVKTDDCKIPRLLRDKLYADFTEQYEHGYKSLKIGILRHYKKRDIRFLMIGLNVETGYAWMGTLMLSADYKISMAAASYVGLCRQSNSKARVQMRHNSDFPKHEVDPADYIKITVFDWETLAPYDPNAKIDSIDFPYIVYVGLPEPGPVLAWIKNLFIEDPVFRDAIHLWKLSEDPHARCPIRIYYNSNGGVRAEKTDGSVNVKSFLL